MRPIQTGWADTPISTNTIELRSNSERGLMADRIPRERAMRSHKPAPPITREAVTGAAEKTRVFTGSRFANEFPSEWWYVSRQRKRAYCTGTGLWSPRECGARWVWGGRGAF